VKVRTAYEDGRYWLVPWRGIPPNLTAAQWPYVEILRVEWRAYQCYRAIDRIWQRRMQRLDNVQFERENPEWRIK
jgi:hypothetical protein